MDFIQELKWRGMIHDIMPGTEEQFQSEMTSAYIGFDPFTDSLHVGNLVQIMTLLHLQNVDISLSFLLEEQLEWLEHFWQK